MIVAKLLSSEELANKMNVEMPIISEAYDVLFHGKKASDGILNLMMRDKKHETESDFLHKI